MRSSKPTHKNPWPRDMIITVEDRHSLLLELLWLREAYELTPQGDNLPPLLSDTPTPLRDAMISTSTQAEWESAWPRIWQAAIHTGIERPGWREEFGDGAFDNDSFRTWSQRGWDAYLATSPVRVEDSPERRDLPNLIPAWRAGLRKIITIPCTGEFTQKLGENTLLMDFATRNNSDSYRQALDTFA